MTNRNIVLEKAVCHTSARRAVDVAAAGAENAAHTLGGKAELLKREGAGQMQPASKHAREHAQNTNPSSKMPRTADGTQAERQIRASRAPAPSGSAPLNRASAPAQEDPIPAPQAPAAPENPSAPQGQPPAPRRRANVPTLEQLEKELKKERRRVDFGRVLRNTVFSLVVVAAVSALIAVLFLPVLQIHGTSMAPTLVDGDIVAAVSVGKCRPGELVAFYYNNNILIKRVIAGPGDWVEIDEDGNVSVNGQPLEEPYLAEKARGNCDITFPYQVPDGRYFVMGDQRATSVDSRNEVVGCVSRDMVIGRIFLRVWPLENLRLF